VKVFVSVYSQECTLNAVGIFEGRLVKKCR
jgi:hypothetical protein